MTLPTRTLSPDRPGEKGIIWKFFILLVLANAVISYFPLSLGMKLVTGLLFLAVPLFFLFRSISAAPTEAVMEIDFLPKPSGMVWVLVIVLAVVFRFWDLTSLSAWPTSDEGWINYLALQLSGKWNWNLLFCGVQVPPAHFWGQALFFRWFGPSLFTLWLFPAFFSVVSLALVYGAARTFFSSRFSFFCFLLAVVNYWFLWCGRLSVSTADVVVPFECLSLIFMGLSLKAINQGGKHWSFLWGLSAGFCLYTATESIFAAGAMGLTAFWVGWKNKSARKELWLKFGLGFSAAAPLIFYALTHRYGSYVNSLWLTKASRNYESHWMAPLFHITALFWGAPDWTFWGGLLNPLEAALVFMGLVFALRNRSRPLFQWMLAAFALFALPGLLTNSFDPFREVLLAPLLIALTAFGWGWLLSDCPARWRTAGTGFLLLICAAMNLFHLWGPYRQAWGRQGPLSSRFKSIEVWRAYDILNSIQRKEGPGIIFQNYVANPELSLQIADYPFNAIENPKLSAVPVRWFAFLTNAQWAFYLSRRFPQSQWYWLSEHLPLDNGGMEMGIIPCTSASVKYLEQWRKADAVLADEVYTRISAQTRDPEGEALAMLQAHQADFEEDPFLRAVYWDKIQEIQTSRGNVPAAIEALQNGIQQGFSNAYFYALLGNLLNQKGQKLEADKAFAEAKILMAKNPMPGR